MRPLSGRRMSRIIRMVVVFPAPFAPRKPKIAPSFTSMDKSLMTRNSANDLLMCSTTSPNVTAPRFFVSIPGLVIFYLPLINLLIHLDYYTRAIASLFYHFLSYAIMGGWIELKICNKEFIVTKISGFLEWLPELRMVELRWIDAIRRVFESYGFCSIETPSVEEIEVLLAKGETDKEIYVINRLQADDDISDARLGLHYDLTVPLARYVAEHFNDLVFPFKRYQIQLAWRGERPQEGRYREFRQCDIDVINIDRLPLQFDAEMPAIIYDILRRLEVGKFQIGISNRKILEGYFRGLGIDDPVSAIRIVDKLDRIGEARVLSYFKSSLNLPRELASRYLALAKIRTTDLSFIDQVQALGIKSNLLNKGLEELTFVIDALSSLPEGTILPDLSIARGFDYYTGTVYECKLIEFPTD